MEVILKRYSKAFIHLQLRFVERLADLMNAELGPVLAEHTVLRNLLNVSIRLEDQSDPLWQAFVGGVSSQPDSTDWAYDFYLKHPAPDGDSDTPGFGCFYYSTYPFRGTPVVRLHFDNPASASVLNREAVGLRQAELKSLFADIRAKHPEAERVRGGSWMYNIEAYRRLFPPEYISTAVSVGYETGFFSLWGQFLRADGTVREAAADHFLRCIEQQHAVDGCLRCFPFEVLRPECSIEVFYKFYGV
jgi:hypothetical protein